MNDENKICFAFIAGREHGRASITIEQFNKIKGILYGNERKEA